MPYKHTIPDAPVAPSMLPRVAAADLTPQDVLILTQPGNNPGQKNKGLELGALFESVKSSLPKETLVVDEQDKYPEHYLINKFKGNSASSYLNNGDVGFHVVTIRNELHLPIIVTASYRSKEVNEAVGGVLSSYHVKGLAADIK